MWRFVLRENIRRYRDLLPDAVSDDERETLAKLLEEAELELNELEDASTSQILKTDASLKLVAENSVLGAIALSGAQFASLQISDPRREHLLILAQRNLRAGFLHWLAHVRPSDGSACGRCLAEDVPVTIEDVNSDADFEPHRATAREAGIRAIHAFPVRDRAGKLIAVLSTYFEAPKRMPEEDIHQMTHFADKVGANLESHLHA